MNTLIPLLIATDLDGTLLDHHDYSHAPAVPTLRRISQCAIPLLLNTSKSRAELIRLRERLDLSGPFAVENGSALYLPVGSLPRRPDGCITQDGFWLYRSGTPRTEILDRLTPLHAQFTFDGFADWDAEQLARISGLPYADAVLALQRDFSEPLRWRDQPERLQAFRSALAAEGLKLLRGGRFFHVMGQCDKGVALRYLRDAVKGDAATPTTIALGDSANDIDMLRAADIAVRVRSPVHAPPQFKSSAQIITTRATGPAGWAEALETLLNQFGFPELSKQGE